MIKLYEAEVGALTTILSQLETAKTKKEFNQLKAKIISYLRIIRAKNMHELQNKDLIRIERNFDLLTKDVYYWFWFEAK